MDNLAIARVLTEIGDLLEIKGENPFKIRAYRNAAETISHEARAVDSLSAADRRALQGIGKDIAAKIAELIATGAIAYHQELARGVSTHASSTCSTCRASARRRSRCSTASWASGRSRSSRGGAPGRTTSRHEEAWARRRKSRSSRRSRNSDRYTGRRLAC